jgi:NAD-dependent deacetylase
MKKLVVLTGAGMSAESNISTFRDSDGLWEKYKVEDVCTPQALENNPTLVLDFYNQRRKQLLEASPNKGHFDLVDLEKDFDVHIITQNVDNLHEQAGSSNILHLHGELMKVRSTGDESLIYDLDKDHYTNQLGDTCEKGFQLRPHIVFFGEAVPMIAEASDLCTQADILAIIGTSMKVYPAASLISYVPEGCPIYFIDPQPNISNNAYPNLHIIAEKAGIGVEKMMKALTKI